MKKIKSLLLYFPFILVSLSLSSQHKVGIFDGHGDIGTNVKPGSATFIPESGQYVISGAGYNIWLDHDEFHFVWKK